jgi:hypothetical protein
MEDTPTPNGQHTTILDDHRNESVRFDSGVEFADVYSACISPTQFPRKQQYNLSHRPFLIEEYSEHSLPRCKRTNSRWRHSELSLSKRLANHSSSSTIIRYENPDTVKSRLKSPLLVSLMSQRMHRPGVMDNMKDSLTRCTRTQPPRPKKQRHRLAHRSQAPCHTQQGRRRSREPGRRRSHGFPSR